MHVHKHIHAAPIRSYVRTYACIQNYDILTFPNNKFHVKLQLGIWQAWDSLLD